LPTEPLERPVQHGLRSSNTGRWRLVSGLIVLLMAGMLLLFFATPFFYVQSVAVAGLKYTTREEVYTLAEMAGLHVFWVDPAQVRTGILRSPTIADATVTLGWPPQMVQIVVQEREPAMLWEQGGVVTWVDVQGRVMRQRADIPGLLRINAEPDSLGDDLQVPLEVVTGALQLKSARPTIDALRYNRVSGLGYTDGRGWTVWFGTGTNMPEKLTMYEDLVSKLLARNIVPTEVNMMNADAPFYRVGGG
jgi:cell division septal protein FtsQ